MIFQPMRGINELDIMAAKHFIQNYQSVALMNVHTFINSNHSVIYTTYSNATYKHTYIHIRAHTHTLSQILYGKLIVLKNQRNIAKYNKPVPIYCSLTNVHSHSTSKKPTTNYNQFKPTILIQIQKLAHTIPIGNNINFHIQNNRYSHPEPVVLSQ